MGVATRVLKAWVRKSAARWLDRVGSKLVAGMTDTSSDAPDAWYQPKRDLYARLRDEGTLRQFEASDR